MSSLAKLYFNNFRLDITLHFVCNLLSVKVHAWWQSNSEKSCWSFPWEIRYCVKSSTSSRSPSRKWHEAYVFSNGGLSLLYIYVLKFCIMFYDVVLDLKSVVVFLLQLCQIEPGQRYSKRLNEEQVTNLLRANCQRPHQRESDIKNVCYLFI